MNMTEIDVMLDTDALMPVRAYSSDAGLDLRTPKDVCVKAGWFTVIDTGVHVLIPEGKVGLLTSKSGLNIIHNIVGEGTIDAGYSGSIHVKLYNLGVDDYIFRRGDKIIQLIILDCHTPEVRLVDELPTTERGSNGLGSSGK